MAALMPVLESQSHRNGADTATAPPALASAEVDNAADDLRPLLVELRAAIDRLPDRISQAAGDAMRQQHKTNRHDLATLWGQIAREADQINEAQLRAAAALDTAKIVRAMDDRFEWLVNELSARFVIFGNALARIEEQLASRSAPTTSRNGHAGHPYIGEQHQPGRFSAS